MIYVTVKLPKMYHQMTFEEFLTCPDDFETVIKNYKETSTRTYEYDKLSNKYTEKIDVNYLIEKLRAFNYAYRNLIACTDKKKLYREFFIPKKSGGLRKIDAPNKELKTALRVLKTILEEDFSALYHTNAFAYIKNRCTIDAVKRHQENESNWYAKYDLSNFFGSTTIDFVLHMLEMIYPFNLVLEDSDGRAELSKALSLAFLDGGLPQGTPISPLITNLIMIPIDYKMTKELRNWEKQKFIYTRYADDFIVSSVYDFKFKEIEKLIEKTLKDFNAPFSINAKKTRYGSRAGSNWNLGVMLGAENKITIGYKKKKIFETMLFNYAMDTKNGIFWPKEDVQHLEGLRSYYYMVEGDVISRIISHISGKTGIDIMRQIKQDLHS